MSTRDDFTKKKALFWVVLVAFCIIVLLILFLVNKNTIYTNLKETDFFGKIFGSTPAVIENHQIKGDRNEEMPLREDFISGNEDSNAFPGLKSGAGAVTSNFGSENELSGNGVSAENGATGLLADNSSGNGVFVGEFGVPGTFTDSDVNGVAGSGVSGGVNASGIPGINSLNNADNISPENAVIPEAGNSLTSFTDGNSGSSNKAELGAFSNATDKNSVSRDITPQASVMMSSLDLCFVLIDADGAVIRKMIKREVPRSDSPLTTAIKLLLEGPDVRNKAEENCRSLIPEGSKLLSARVSDGVAYLNFNDSFEFNPFGVEGAIHQLEQVVYTATAFSTVNSVQFLIEGDKREYLGSEGQWIGTPLSRANFR